MKKPVKLILRGSALIIGLILIVALIYLVYFIRETKKMTPAETMAINDSVWCIKDKFVNAYIFKCQNSYLIVDAGFSKKSFSKELNKLKIKPEWIKSILLTHTDGDHIGAIGLFTNPAIYMHSNEEQMINGNMGKTKFSRTKWKYGPYKLFENNDTLNIDGLRINIIHTPGHTPGSSCFIINSTYLLTGDNLVISDGRYEHFIEKFNMDTQKQIESLKVLPNPGTFKYILTGHNGIIEVKNQIKF